jgi:hypothetical protein
MVMSVAWIAHVRPPADGLTGKWIYRWKWISRHIHRRCWHSRDCGNPCCSQRATPTNMLSEAVMRIGSVLLLIWLVIGAIVGGQRHYSSDSDPNCAQTGTIIVTVLAGPLNYSGVNPKISCKTPQPS